MNPLIVIPMYICSRRRKEGDGVLSTYDHATALNQPGELDRLLKSLHGIADVGQIVVLVVSESAIEQQAVDKALSIVSKYPDMHIAVIGNAESALVQQRFEQLGVGRLNREVGLVGYGAVHNMGLVIANVLGFDSVVFIDDDEIVEDPDFMRKSVYGLGKCTQRGTPILAKTGFFYNSQGSYLADSSFQWYNAFWKQADAYNEWVTSAMNGPRLSRSNYVAGGCLAIHAQAFTHVAFDPFIPRGEDLDYMLNLRMYGADVWFDNRWSLHHLPPESLSEGTRFRQDAYRWLYEYRKLEYSKTQIDLIPVRPASLEPYPGPMLSAGIEKRIHATALLRSAGRADKEAYLRAAHVVRSEATNYATRNCAKYFEFQHLWPQMMARITGDAVLAEALVQSVTARAAAFTAASAEGTSASGRAARMQRAAEMPMLDPGKTGEIRLNIAEG